MFHNKKCCSIYYVFISVFHSLRFSHSTGKKAAWGDSLSLFITPPHIEIVSSFSDIIQHGARETPAPYKCIINFCSLGSFSFSSSSLVADGEEKYSRKVILLLVLVWRSDGDVWWFLLFLEIDELLI
jgi:hypothetical protein